MTPSIRSANVAGQVRLLDLRHARANIIESSLRIFEIRRRRLGVSPSEFDIVTAGFQFGLSVPESVFGGIESCSGVPKQLQRVRRLFTHFGEQFLRLTQLGLRRLDRGRRSAWRRCCSCRRWTGRQRDEQVQAAALGHIHEPSSTKLRKCTRVANDRMDGRGECVRLDGISRADRDARSGSGHGAHGFLHRFERASQIGAGLRLADCRREMFDRYRVFVNDGVERPGYSARFTQRLHERRIVTSLFGAQLFGERIAPADEALEWRLIHREYCRREIGYDGRLRHDGICRESRRMCQG